MAERNDPWYNLDDRNSERVDGRMDPVTGTGFRMFLKGYLDNLSS